MLLEIDNNLLKDWLESKGFIVPNQRALEDAMVHDINRHRASLRWKYCQEVDTNDDGIRLMSDLPEHLQDYVYP